MTSTYPSITGLVCVLQTSTGLCVGDLGFVLAKAVFTNSFRLARSLENLPLVMSAEDLVSRTSSSEPWREPWRGNCSNSRSRYLSSTMKVISSVKARCVPSHFSRSCLWNSQVMSGAAVDLPPPGPLFFFKPNYAALNNSAAYECEVGALTGSFAFQS